MFRFAYPYVLAAIVLVPLVVYLALRGRRQRSVGYSSLSLLLGAGLEASAWKRYGRIALRALVIALAIVAVARPQTGESEYKTHTEGVDIMLVLDASGSMQAEDPPMGDTSPGGKRIDRAGQGFQRIANWSRHSAAP